MFQNQWSTGCEIAGSSTRVSVPRVLAPRCAFVGVPRGAAGSLLPPGGEEVWATPRQGGGSEAAAELWRVGATQDSPRWGPALVTSPLELIMSLSARTPLCQGMAAGVERRGPVIVCGLPSANCARGAVCVDVAHCSVDPPPPSSRTPPSALVSTEPMRWWGLPQVALQPGALPISQWEKAGLLNGSVKPAQTAAESVAPTSK